MPTNELEQDIFTEEHTHSQTKIFSLSLKRIFPKTKYQLQDHLKVTHYPTNSLNVKTVNNQLIQLSVFPHSVQHENKLTAYSINCSFLKFKAYIETARVLDILKVLSSAALHKL